MSDKHTTLRIKDALMRRAKMYAQRHDLTLTAVMERALVAYLANPERTPDADTPLVLPAFGRGGPRRGVDLDDTSALLDRMDGIE